MALQTPFMWDYVGRESFNEPSGRFVMGEHALYRWYECADGFVFIATKGDDAALRAVQSVPFLLDAFPYSMRELPADQVIGSAAVTSNVAACFRRHSQMDVLAALNDAGVAAVKQGFMHANREKNISTATKFSLRTDQEGVDGSTMQWIRQTDHPSGQTVEMYAPCCIRPWHAMVMNPSMQPKHGAHSDEILAEMGYDAAAITALHQKGVVTSSWSVDYTPDGDPWAEQDKLRYAKAKL